MILLDGFAAPASAYLAILSIPFIVGILGVLFFKLLDRWSGVKKK